MGVYRHDYEQSLARNSIGTISGGTDQDIDG